MPENYILGRKISSETRSKLPRRAGCRAMGGARARPGGDSALQREIWGLAASASGAGGTGGSSTAREGCRRAPGGLLAYGGAVCLSSIQAYF